MNNGTKVKIKFKENSAFEGKEEILRNVTEIHYNYSTLSIMGKMIAFESNIHNTGITYPIEYIDEFETELETKKAKEF